MDISFSRPISWPVDNIINESTKSQVSIRLGQAYIDFLTNYHYLIILSSLSNFEEALKVPLDQFCHYNTHLTLK